MLGKKDGEVLHARFDNLLQPGRGDFVVRFNDHFAGFSVDHVGGRVSAFELLRLHFDFADVGFAQAFERRTCDFLALADNRIAAAAFDLEIDFHANQIRPAALWHLEHQAAVGHAHFIDDVERTDQILV